MIDFVVILLGNDMVAQICFIKLQCVRNMHYNVTEAIIFIRNVIMKTITTTGVILGAVLTLGGCTSTQVGTTTGAAAGAGLGYAVSGGSGLGAVVGAGAGALIGNQIGQSQDRRYYNRGYYNRGYYNHRYYY